MGTGSEEIFTRQVLEEIAGKNRVEPFAWKSVKLRTWLYMGSDTFGGKLGNIRREINDVLLCRLDLINEIAVPST
jgi:hypothetical protein